MAIFSVIVTTGGMDFYTGMDYARANFAILEDEITDARGSASSMAARLAASLNQDGSLIAGSSVAVDWKESGYTAEKVDADTFKVTDPDTDLTSVLGRGLRVRFNNDGTAVYGTIKASSYAASETTVDIFTDNVPATITQLDYGIVAIGQSLVPIIPVATKPASYDQTYACKLLMAIDTGVVWYGNPIAAAFESIGGNMTYKDYDNSADQGGTAVNVTQAGGAVTTRLDFGTPTTLAGYLTRLAVVGTNRAAITCDNFVVEVYENSDANAEDLVCQYANLDGTVEPFGIDLRNLHYAIRNSDSTNTGSLWVKITNLKNADDSDFDIEAIVEHCKEG